MGTDVAGSRVRAYPFTSSLAAASAVSNRGEFRVRGPLQVVPRSALEAAAGTFRPVVPGPAPQGEGGGPRGGAGTVADSGVLGRSIALDDQPVEVVGVLPRSGGDLTPVENAVRPAGLP